jgi:shikimate 5-dehydrogenase/shikimate kinase
MTRYVHNSWPSVRSFDQDASIVLVGSRGAGKRSLGFIAATRLGRRFITEDQYFVSITGTTRGDYIRQHGNEKFYHQNVEVIRHMLFQNRIKCVIECGMGSLAHEAQDLLREYAKSNPVIHIIRNSNSIGRLLRLDENGTARLENADLTHRYCSNLEYYNLYDPTCEELGSATSEDCDRGSPEYSFKLKNAKQDFFTFVDTVTGWQGHLPSSDNPFSIAAVPAEKRVFTYALHARLSDFLQGSLDIDELELDSCGDVVELRIDVQPSASLKDIAKLVALIRRKIGVPLVVDVDYNLRKKNGEGWYFKLLWYALRLGIDYLIVDLKCSPETVKRLVQFKGRTKIVGDFFDTRPHCPDSWSDGFLLEQYLRGERLGCELVRISRVAVKGNGNDDLASFREEVRSLSRPSPPPILIAYNTGPLGHSSQVSNPTFTPVSSVILSDLGGIIKRDPESLAAQEAMRTLYKRRTFDPLHFYLVGESVFYSLSPVIHNEAYHICGMENEYQLYETSSIEDLRRLCQDPYFGGASISQPFKVGIVKDLQSMSKHATAIGAVNTILPIRAFPDSIVPDNEFEFLVYQAKQRGRAGPVIAWYGDNTDWIGITSCLQRNISPRNTIQRKTTGLVIGAGGMARAATYALIQLGCRKIYIHNRSSDRAQKVADHFNALKTDSSEADTDLPVEVLTSTSHNWPTGQQLPTIIISAIPAHTIKNRPAANFILPVQWLGSLTGGVVIEVRNPFSCINKC